MRPKTQLNVRLDTELVERLRTLQRDPVTKRTRYGSMSILIESLLWDWVQANTKKEKSS